MRFLVPFLLAALLAVGAGAQVYDSVYGPVSRSGYASGASLGSLWTGEVKTTVFVHSSADVGTHISPEFVAAMAAADEVVYVDTDPDAEFAHVTIDRFESGQLLPLIMSQYAFTSWNTDTGDATDYYDLTSGTNIIDTARRASPWHIAFENYIPAGAHVIHAARYGVAWAGPFNMTAVDSMYSVLMTNPNDDKWYQVVGLTNGDFLAHSSWDEQQNWTPGGLYGYGTTDPGFPWVPALDDRHRFWDWGDVADSRGWAAASVASDEVVEHPLTNCVQAVVNGAVNNGVIEFRTAKTSTRRRLMEYGWEAGDNGYGDSQPWVVVEWMSRPYSAPWPRGGEVAFAFVTDGAQVALNALATTAYQAYPGAMYTLTARGNYLYSGVEEDPPGTPTGRTFATPTQIAAWYDTGVIEVANQSYYGAALTTYSGASWPADHNPLALVTDYSVGMYPDLITQVGETDWDMLMFAVDPEWMFYEFESATGYSWRTKPYFAQTFAHPESDPGPDGLRAVTYFDYTAGRMPIVSKIVTDNDGNYDPRVTPTYDAEGDSLRGNIRPQNVNGPQNWRYLAMTHASDDFVGVSADNPSAAQVYFNFRLEFEKAKSNGRGIVSFFTHSTKSNTYYSTGIDYDELQQGLLALSDAGGVALCMFDLVKWIKDGSAPVATPVGYAQDPEFKYTADEGVWRQLDGTSNQWVRGYE